MNSGASTEIDRQKADGLIADGLSCIRGGQLLFRNLEFTLTSGQAGLVTGPNGAGKSSLLRLITGLLEPAAGNIHAPMPVCLCDDRMALDEHLPLEKALGFWAKIDRASDSIVHSAMTQAGLDHLAEVPVRYFSTGQRQRARLARTYQSGAKLWLLDEPANGLDTASVVQLGAVLKDHLDGGGILLAASHIPLPVDFDLSLNLDPLEPLESGL